MTHRLFKGLLAQVLALLLIFQAIPLRGQDLPVPVAPIRTSRNHPTPQPPLLAPKLKSRYLPASPADSADPYIVAQAAALGNNPNQIFAFVRDHIAFEPYYGSVRGARGALWAQAGNMLDRASLLVALLGAVGFTATYQHAYIVSTNTQANLLHAMFPQTSRLVGCVPGGVATTDPAITYAAVFGSSDYYWVTYGPQNIALDPNVATNQPGQSFQTPDSSFTTVPQNLRQQVTIKINAELYSQASGLFGLGPSTTTVLTQTFDASALVGNIVTAGNLVAGSGGGALDFSAITFTYTPYILIGSGGPDASQDTIITGTDYQELFTNFPLGSQVLTGLFLEVDAQDINYTQHAYTHTIFDRLGPAARSGNASVSLSLPSPPAPALTDFDLATVNILTARQTLSSFQSQQTRLTNALNNYEAIKPQLALVPTTGTLTNAQKQIVQQGVTLQKYVAIAENELITMSYDGAADAVAAQLSTGYYVRVYPNSPRLTIAHTSSAATISLDVLKNDMLVIPGSGQNINAPYYEEVARGMIESVMEGQVLSQATGQTTTAIGDVFGALGDPNLLTVVGPTINNNIPANPDALASTTLSPDAQTLILQDVANGNVVITPTKMVTVNGVTTVGWWMTDQNGHTTSHFVNGGHQAIAEFGAVLEFAVGQYNSQVAGFIGHMEGFAVAGIAFAAAVLQGVASNSSFSGVLKGAKNTIAGANGSGAAGTFFLYLDVIIATIKDKIPVASGVYGGFSLIASFGLGLLDGITQAKNWLARYLPNDPEVLTFIGTPLDPPPAGVTPGATPGVQMGALTVDSYFTMPFNGNQLPVYDQTITNTGPSTDTFNINIQDLSNYFKVYPSVPSLTLLPGQTGMVNVCVIPFDTTGSQLPPPGTAQNYTVNVTSATNSNVKASTAPSFNAPPLPTLDFTIDPISPSTVPGGTVSANLNIASVGNAATGPVTLTVTPPTGITVNGLTSPANVPLNGVVTEAISFTASPSLATNTYNVSFTASYTPSGGTTQQVPFTVPITVAALGSCAVSTASVASQLGKTALAVDLRSLLIDMNAAAAAPSSAAAVSRVVGDMNLMIAQEINGTFLQSLAPNLTAATNAVASATPATLLTALGNLNTALCPIGTTLNQANMFNTNIRLSPNNQVTGPNLPATFTILLNNSPASTSLQVFDLSVTGVPNGVTAHFSQPSITLGPWGSNANFSNSVTLTLTPGAAFTAPFSFNVVATPRGAPEFAVAGPGDLFVRAQTVNVDQVTATPALANPGTPITISARVFAVVNEDIPSANLQVSIVNSSGQTVLFPTNSNPFNITTTANLQTVTFNPIDTSNANLFKAGSYIVSVQAFSGGTPLGNPATGPMVLGSPLTAALTANPSIVLPGSSTVQAALTITRDSIQNPLSTLIGTVQVNGVPRTMALYANGQQQLAYVCSDSQVNIVDVTNPASPSVLSTFANSLLTENGAVPGFSTVSCGIYNTDLILSYSRETGNTSTDPTKVPTNFAVFSLANPLSPVAVGGVTPVQRPDSGGLYLLGNSALLIQNDVTYNPFSNFIQQQNGDVWVLDLTNAPATGSVAFLSDLYPCGGINPQTNVCNNGVGSGVNFIPNNQYLGGPYAVHPGTEVNSTTAYFASSSSTGGNTEEPGSSPFDGQLLVVNDSNPHALSITTKVDVPLAAYLSEVAVQGNTALAVGDSLGVYDINSGYVGNLVLASFDITNPSNPVLLNTVVTALTDKGGATVVALGNNTFAVGGTSNNGKGSLVLVDASNPSALRYVPYDALFVASPTVAKNPYFYTLSATPIASSNQLSIFQLSTINGPQLSVSLQIPNTANVSLVPGTFNQTPSSSTPGPNYTTYVWTQPSLNTITFNMNVSGVNPGDVTTIVNSGELDYTVPVLGSGKLQLGALSVLTKQIMSISPDSQNVNNGGITANYTVTISNPTTSSQTFNLSVIAPSGWTIGAPASITVPAGGSQNFNVAVTPALNVQLGFGAYTFTVAANTIGGLSASVSALLGLANGGTNTGGNGNTRFLNFTASLTPSQVIAGQGDYSQPFTISITNTGNFADTIQVSGVSNLPPGWNYSFTPSILATPQPGSTSTITGTIFAGIGYTPGPYLLTIPVQYGSIIQNLNVTVNVSGAGVEGFISPNPGPSTSSFILTLINTGLAQDTFKLSVVGALSQAASLLASVTLPAGARQDIPITMNAVNYVLPSTVQLQVLAVSQTVPAVQTLISANVTVPSAQGVTASIAPSPASVSTNPGSVALRLHAANTGNVTDSYTAKITGTTGPVTASLVNVNGQSGQSIPVFFVTALSAAEFPLNATVTGSGTSTVTVQVTSLSNPAITATSTVTINGPAQQSSPTANAGLGGTIPLRRIAILNGSASSDPNSPPLALTYAWTLVSAPAGSSVTTASIRFPSSPEAVFVPDVAGNYTFKLTVTNSAGSSTANVTYNAQILPPIAVTGKMQNVKTGGFVFLNGKDSYDPNSLPLTFAWSFSALPNGSALNAASLLNATTPKPFFTPDVNGVYTLQLIVSNGTLQSQASLVQITAGSGSLPPNARAGADQNAKTLTETVTVNGSASYDPNSPPLALTYAWSFKTLPQGSTAQIQSANTAQAQFVPDVAGDFVLNLHVTNSAGASDDTVTVHAFVGYTQSYLKDVPPNALTGPDQYAAPGSPVTLVGSASSDPDSGPLPLSYNWWFNALPASSTAALAGPTTSGPHFTPDLTGYYIARLEASDGFASGFSNTLVTAAQKCDADANGTINQIDIALIQAALGQPAGLNDPRDPLAAGTVTSQDLAYCQALIVPPVLPNAGSVPPSLTFTTLLGTNPPPQNLIVTSSGAAFNFTLSSDQTWLVATGSGSTTSNSNAISIVTTGLTLPVYHGNVIVTSSGAANSPFKIPVTLNLTSTSIAATAGTPAIASLGAQFGVLFQATVTDANKNALPGATVTFTAPSTGASGTFPGNLLTATATTNASGVATAPAFVANSTAGNYSVTASVAGGAAPAAFALTNAAPGATSLGGAIGGKSGPSNARVWVFQVGNNGPGSALGAQITSITFAETSGVACTPVITGPARFPLLVGNIAPQAIANVNVTIDFTGCAANAAFRVTAAEWANNGAATGTIVRLNQFQ